MSKRVLCLLVDGFEETETVTPVNLMRRGGLEVVMASLHGGVVEGRGGMRLEPDEDFEDVEAQSFDLLFLPGRRRRRRAIRPVEPGDTSAMRCSKVRVIR